MVPPDPWYVVIKLANGAKKLISIPGEWNPRVGTAHRDRVEDWRPRQRRERRRLLDGAALCWPVLFALWRLVTSPHIAGPHAVSVPTGWGIVSGYLAQPAMSLVRQGREHAAISEELSRTPGLRSDDVPRHRGRRPRHRARHGAGHPRSRLPQVSAPPRSRSADLRAPAGVGRGG